MWLQGPQSWESILAWRKEVCVLTLTAPPQPSDLLSYEPPFPSLQPGAGSACPTGDERTISVKGLATWERAIQKLDEMRVNVHCSGKKNETKKPCFS